MVVQIMCCGRKMMPAVDQRAQAAVRGPVNAEAPEARCAENLNHPRRARVHGPSHGCLGSSRPKPPETSPRPARPASAKLAGPPPAGASVGGIQARTRRPPPASGSSGPFLVSLQSPAGQSPGRRRTARLAQPCRVIALTVLRPGPPRPPHKIGAAAAPAGHGDRAGRGQETPGPGPVSCVSGSGARAGTQGRPAVARIAAGAVKARQRRGARAPAPARTRLPSGVE